MSWPIVNPKSHTPAAGFGLSSSLLYTPASVPEEPVRVPNQTHPELRLFNLTNGYNAMPIIPPDARIEYQSPLEGPLPEDVFVPRTLASYMEHESRNVSVDGSGNTGNAVYDPAVGRLFDIGLIRDGLDGFEYMRHTRRQTPRSIFNVACYVTGQERTAVGLSLMTLMPARREFERIFRVDDYVHEYALPYLPSLRTFNLLRTDTPVKDVRLITPTTDHHPAARAKGAISSIEAYLCAQKAILPCTGCGLTTTCHLRCNNLCQTGAWQLASCQWKTMVLCQVLLLITPCACHSKPAM